MLLLICRVSYHTGTCGAAALGGHFEVLQWAREHGCPWDQFTCSRAAEGEHLEVLQWLRAHDCPWNEEVCCFAAKLGNMEMLTWALESGRASREYSFQLALAAVCP